MTLKFSPEANLHWDLEELQSMIDQVSSVLTCARWAAESGNAGTGTLAEVLAGTDKLLEGIRKRMEEIKPPIMADGQIVKSSEGPADKGCARSQAQEENS